MQDLTPIPLILMHHPCDYTSYFNLITISHLNPSKCKVDRHKVFNTTFSKQPLYKEFTTYHGNHNIIGSMGLWGKVSPLSLLFV